MRTMPTVRIRLLTPNNLKNSELRIRINNFSHCSRELQTTGIGT